MEIWSYIGVLFVAYVFFRFLTVIGKRIPILELMVLTAGLQWVVGAFIEYRTSFQHFKYYMYVDEFTYMSYVVPAYILFSCVILYGSRKYTVFADINKISFNSTIGILFVFIGIFAQITIQYSPSSLLFIFYLFSNFKYIGVIILYFSKVKWHRKLFYAAIFYLFLASLISSFFHEFIIWTAFFYMFWALKNKPNLKTNLLIIIMGFVFSTMIQAVKLDYRTIIMSGYNGNYTSLFTDILIKRLSGGLTENKDEQSELNIRLNQGWIISAIMKHTPTVQPFGYGTTIGDAIFASVLPRFLNPNKKQASGRGNIQKFTGLNINQNTSMGMSLIGEAYANFGRLGGMLFLLIYGFFIKRVWQFLIHKTNKKFILIFFLPLIFFQVIKAETELLTVLNHLVKSSLLVFVFIFLIIGNLNFINRR